MKLRIIKKVLCLSIVMPVLLLINSCCDCLPPCEDINPYIIDDKSLEWFEFFENSSGIPYVSTRTIQNYYSEDDTIVRTESIDSISFLKSSELIEDSECYMGCPVICQSIEGISGTTMLRDINPRVKYTMQEYLQLQGVISVEIIGPNPQNRVYRFSMNNLGELVNDVSVSKVKRENGKLEYSFVNQEIIDGVKFAKKDELNFEGKTYTNCYEILDSISHNPGSFDYFKFIMCKEEGPILFERHYSYYDSDLDITQFDLHTIKKVN